MWGDPRPSNRMDQFRRNQEERFATGWNRDFHARLDGLALERNAGGFQGGRESSRPFEFSGMLGPTGRHFASREEAPFRFGARDGPLADFRAGDFQARELHARQLAMLEFRGRDAATTEFRGRETHPMDYRGREGPLMNYREGDGAPIDFRNRELTPMEFKDRVPPHMDYRERESLADFRSRDAPPDYRGRGMLDMDFRSKEQPIPDLRGINTSDNDFRNRNHPLPDFRAKDGSHLEFLGNNSSPLDFRGKEGSQLDFRSRDVPHSEFRGPGSSDLDFRGRDPTMFNLQGNERPRTDQDFRDRGVAGAPVDLMERARIPPNQPLVDYMQSQPAVRTPDQELHEGRSDKTGDPVQARPPLNSEQQTDNQGSEGQSLGPPPPDFKNGCGPPTPVPDQEQAAAATVPTRQPPATGEQNRGPLGRGVKRGVDLDFLGRQDTDYRNMDYRDVDLRFDYGHSKEPVEERPAKEPRQDLQDQDYRPASSGEDSASRYIQVQGVPATATKEEIIEAFIAPDGNSVPDLQLTDYNPGGVISVRSPPKEVWICGHSLVQCAKERARRLPHGTQLGISCHKAKITWMGEVGMKWDQLIPTMQEMVGKSPAPDLIVVHLGENDLIQMTGVDLIIRIKKDLRSLVALFPQAHIMWSSLLPRRVWLGAKKPAAIDRARKEINREVKLFCRQVGVLQLQHDAIRYESPHQFSKEGEQLSEMGLDIFTADLQASIQGWLNVR